MVLVRKSFVCVWCVCLCVWCVCAHMHAVLVSNCRTHGCSVMVDRGRVRLALLTYLTEVTGALGAKTLISLSILEKSLQQTFPWLISINEGSHWCVLGAPPFSSHSTSLVVFDPIYGSSAARPASSGVLRDSEGPEPRAVHRVGGQEHRLGAPAVYCPTFPW